MRSEQSRWQFAVAHTLEKIYPDYTPPRRGVELGLSVFMGETASFQVALSRRGTPRVAKPKH